MMHLLKKLLKRGILGIVISMMLFAPVAVTPTAPTFFTPQRAEAFDLDDIFNALGSLFESNSSVQETTQTGLSFAEFIFQKVLNPLAIAAARKMLKVMNDRVYTWVSNGGTLNGEPFFLKSDLGTVFNELSDETFRLVLSNINLSRPLSADGWVEMNPAQLLPVILADIDQNFKLPGNLGNVQITRAGSRVVTKPGQEGFGCDAQGNNCDVPGVPPRQVTEYRVDLNNNLALLYDENGVFIRKIQGTGENIFAKRLTSIVVNTYKQKPIDILRAAALEFIGPNWVNIGTDAYAIFDPNDPYAILDPSLLAEVSEIPQVYATANLIKRRIAGQIQSKSTELQTSGFVSQRRCIAWESVPFPDGTTERQCREYRNQTPAGSIGDIVENAVSSNFDVLENVDTWQEVAVEAFAAFTGNIVEGVFTAGGNAVREAIASKNDPANVVGIRGLGAFDPDNVTEGQIGADTVSVDGTRRLLQDRTVDFSQLKNQAQLTVEEAYYLKAATLRLNQTGKLLYKLDRVCAMGPDFKWEDRLLKVFNGRITDLQGLVQRGVGDEDTEQAHANLLEDLNRSLNMVLDTVKESIRFNPIIEMQLIRDVIAKSEEDAVLTEKIGGRATDLRLTGQFLATLEKEIRKVAPVLLEEPPVWEGDVPNQDPTLPPSQANIDYTTYLAQLEDYNARYDAFLDTLNESVSFRRTMARIVNQYLGIEDGISTVESLNEAKADSELAEEKTDLILNMGIDCAEVIREYETGQKVSIDLEDLPIVTEYIPGVGEIEVPDIDTAFGGYQKTHRYVHTSPPDILNHRFNSPGVVNPDLGYAPFDEWARIMKRYKYHEPTPLYIESLSLLPYSTRTDVNEEPVELSDGTPVIVYDFDLFANDRLCGGSTPWYDDNQMDDVNTIPSGTGAYVDMHQLIYRGVGGKYRLNDSGGEQENIRGKPWPIGDRIECKDWYRLDNETGSIYSSFEGL